MRNIYRSLLLLLVGATQKELARHVRYLKVENQILRSKLPARVASARGIGIAMTTGKPAAAASSACNWGDERPGKAIRSNVLGSVSSHKEKFMTTTGLIIWVFRDSCG